MLRNYIDMAENNYEILRSIRIKTNSGIETLSEILKDIDKAKYYIPDKWPIVKDQNGPCCGLYALEIALNYGFAHLNYWIPPARKEKKPDTVSLRQVAKRNKLSAFGEIYDVESFEKLAIHFGFDNCEVVKFKKVVSSVQQYSYKIIMQLKKGNTLVVACDLKKGECFPGVSAGLRAHWALLLGYFYKDKQLFFIAAQYGEFYAWPAEDLYLCNQALPVANPKTEPHYGYVKYKDRRGSDFCKIQDTVTQKNVKIRYAIGDNLEKFRYGLFSVPAHNQAKPVSLDTVFDAQFVAKRIKVS